jgi:uncharacterized protein
MRFLIVLMMMVSCAACSAGPSVEIAGKRFTVEVADTQEKQALGLMYRDELADDRGMVFLFPSEAPRSFWMKNCRISLDILYFDKDLKMVSSALSAPPCRTQSCPSYPSKAPAMYVLELRAGMATELGIAVGDSLILDLD